MAKRSDFAQKLLDDLRLRKERLIASESSHQANLSAADGHAYSSRSSRGSLMQKAHEQTGLQIGNTQTRSSSANKFITNRETSNQIVSFKGSQRSGTIDLSTALAFAIENAGKATRLDPSDTTSILGFLHQIGKRSMNYGKMEKKGSMERHQISSGHLPTVHLQIKEISKGAQKLNQIIKTCTTSLRFGRYSIEYGKELMKGATDLEQSLRMLVDIQEASEYVISPRRKSRIKLLDDKGEEDDDYERTDQTYEQRQLELPRFSFDNPSRYYRDIQEIARADVKMRLAALTYPSETNLDHGKQTLAKSKGSSHRRSVSYSSDAKSMYLEEHDNLCSTQPKKEKRRIPNVIAKLMGLGEPPEDEASNRNEPTDLNSKGKTEGLISTKSVVSKTKRTEQKKKGTSFMSHQSLKHEVTQTDNGIASPDLDALQPRVNQAPQNFIAADVPVRDDLASKYIKSKRINQKDIRGKGEDSNALYKRKNADATTETEFREEPQSMTPHMHRRPKSVVSYQEDNKCKSVTQKENEKANKPETRGQERPQKELGFKQSPLTAQNSKPPQIEQQVKEQKHENEKLQVSNNSGSMSTPTRLSKHMEKSINPKKKQLRTNQAPAGRRNSPDLREAVKWRVSPEINNCKSHPNISYNNHVKADVKNTDGISSNGIHSSKESQPEMAQVKTLPDMEKTVNQQAMRKPQVVNMHKQETQNQSLSITTAPTKHSVSGLQGGKEQKSEKLRASISKDCEVPTSKSENSAGHINALRATKSQKEVKGGPLACTPEVNRSRRHKVSKPPPGTNMRQKTLPAANQAPECISSELKPNKIVLSALKGKDEKAVDVALASSVEELFIPEKPKLLTENEKNLKHIVIKSQLFLDTAEALLKLHMPYDILDAGGHHDQGDQESKLVLDCGYEVMKRRGRRQELSTHPFLKAPTRTPSVKSLDDLVRQLYRDLEELRTYGRNGFRDLPVEDYLPKILETDVHFIHPDLNCMWDLGWNQRTFAFMERDEVVREMERCILNGLLEEASADLPVRV